MVHKNTRLLILILLTIILTACSGAGPETVQTGVAEELAALEISTLDKNPSPDAGTSDSQPISQETTPRTEPQVAESPEQLETPAETSETSAETQPVSNSAAIGGFLGAELAPFYTLSVNVAGSESATVTAVTFSPDNTMIAAAQSDGTVRLWDSGGGDILFTLTGHTGQVTDLAFSADSALLASAGEDKQVLIWDTEGGTLVKTISTSLIGRAQAVTFSPDGNQVAVGGQNCAVAQYSIWTGLLNRTFPQPGCDLLDSGSVESWGLAYTADGALLITADGQIGEGGSIQIWQLDTYLGAEQVDYFYLGIQDMALSPNGAELAVALIGSSQVTLADAADGSELHTFAGHDHRVNSVTFSPDGRLVVSGSRDATVCIWDAASGFLLRTLEGHTEAVNAVAFSPDGALIASGSDDGTVIVWGVDLAGDE